MPPDGSPSRILVADDSLMTQRLLSRLAADLGFSDIHLASDGQSALQLWRDLRPQLVLLDILMPTMSGIEVLSAIRQEDSDVKIIMISGIQGRDPVLRCREMRANGYLVKPLDMERVRSLLLRVAGDLLSGDEHAELPPDSSSRLDDEES